MTSKSAPNSSARGALNALLKIDYASFVERSLRQIYPGVAYHPAPYINFLTELLGEIRKASGVRYVINMPPRHLKSFLTSVSLPAFLLGQDPTIRIIAVSYSDGLASSFAGHCREILRSQWYRDVFPGTEIKIDRDQRDDFETTRGGGRLSSSMRSGVIGRGADVMLIDDPIDANDAFSQAERDRAKQIYASGLATRFNEPGTASIIAVGHRVHEDDLFDFLLVGGGFRHIRLPFFAEDDEEISIGRPLLRRKKGELLNPAMYRPADAEQVRGRIAPSVFALQYQQRVDAAAGQLIFEEDLIPYETLPGGLGRPVMSIDPATGLTDGSSFSAVIIVAQKVDQHFIEEVRRARLSYEDLEARVIRTAEQHRPRAVVVEKTTIGPALAAKLASKGFDVHEVVPGARTKRERIEAHLDVIKGKRLHIRSGASWRPDFVKELITFPVGRFDDYVDALSQYLAWARDSTGGRRFPPVTLGLGLSGRYGGPRRSTIIANRIRDLKR